MQKLIYLKLEQRKIESDLKEVEREKDQFSKHILNQTDFQNEFN